MALLDVVRTALDAAQWRYKVTEQGDACRLNFSGRSTEYRCLVLADDVSEQVGVLLRSPQRVPAARLAAVCEYVVRVNYGLRVGCLDLDHSDGEFRFRAAVDAEGCDLPDAVVRMLIQHALWTMDAYHEGMLRVAFGDVSPAAAVTAAREAERRRYEAAQAAEHASSEVDIDAVLRELGAAGPASSDETPDDAPSRRRLRRPRRGETAEE